MASFSFKNNVRVGELSLPFFSEVHLTKDIHTIKIRHFGHYFKEIQFLGKNSQCTTKSIKEGGEWYSYPLGENDQIIGIFGE